MVGVPQPRVAVSAQRNAIRSKTVFCASPESRVKLYVVPTDEELMIAEHTLATMPGCWQQLSAGDAFVFTAGIGENSAGIRARISEKLTWLGAELDAKANAGRKPLISRPDSRVKLFVIPTDEELMIAEHTIATIAQSKTSDLIGLR